MSFQLATGRNNIVVVKITAKDRTDFTTKTYYFGTRAYTSDEAPYDIHKLLIGLSGFDSRLGTTISERRTGTATFVNTRGSLTRDTKLFDLTLRYAFELQPIEVLVAKTAIDAPPASFETEFKGIITDLEQNEDGTCTMRFESDIDTCSIVQERITREKAANAHPRSLGKYLPWIFGQAEVPLYSLAENQEYDPVYAYGSSRDTTFQYDDDPTDAKLYGKDDRQGKFIELEEGTAGTFVWKSVSSTTPWTDETIGDNGREYADTVLAPLSARLEGAIITHITQKFHGNGSAGTVSGNTFCYLYTVDPNTGLPDQQIGRGVVDNTDYTANIQGSSEYDIVFALEKAVITANYAGGYAVGIKVVLEDPSTHIGPVYRIGGSALPDFIRNDSSDTNSGNEWRAGGLGTVREVKLHAATWEFDHTLNMGTIEFSQKAAPTNQTNPDLTDLNLVLRSEGLVGPDDEDGVTDVSINNAYRVAAFMLRDCPSPIKDTAFSSQDILTSTRPREINGATTGRQLARSVISEVCSNSVCKLAIRRNGDYVLWAYGAEQTPVKILNEQDIRLINIYRADASSVVNYVDIAYKPTVREGDLVDIQVDQPKGYGESIQFSKDQGSPVSKVAEDSEEIYGRRPLSENFTTLKYIRDQPSARFFGESWINQSPYPRLFTNIELPYWRESYREIELLDLLDLSHIDLPSFKGTATSLRVKDPTIEGEGITDFYNDYVYLWRYAQRFKLRVLSKTVNFNISTGLNSVIQLRCMILDNPHEIV